MIVFSGGTRWLRSLVGGGSLGRGAVVYNKVDFSERMTMLDTSTIRAQFERRFGRPPQVVVRAPGRVNLIGEHTDYNDGFVFPVAIDRATYVAAAPSATATITALAADLNDEDTFALDAVVHNPAQPWSNYLRGVVKGLQAAGHPIGGAELLIVSDVPRGSGLSSSAAFEVAVGYSLQLLNKLNLLGEELALLAQGAENTFVGVQCGIMDQFISALGQAGHAMLLDCRDLSYRTVPLPPEAYVVICDSGVRHEHGSSGYNERRAQCEEAVALLKSAMPKITALRDVRPADLAAHGHLLPEIVLRRARHVVSENQRVLDSVAALDAGDLAAFGRLMNESHRSMRDDYAITVPAIDALVAAAQAIPGCYGSRMTGGGFGGCTVSMVEHGAYEGFAARVRAAYHVATGRETTIYVCSAEDGVRKAE